MRSTAAKLALASGLALGAVTPGCGGSGGPTGGAVSPACAASPPSDTAPAPLRRLTRFEYGRTLHDLTGADVALARELPPDEETLGFDDIAAAYSVSALHAAKYLEVAERAAADLTAGAGVTAIAACDPRGGDAACLERFIATFGRLAWRRPLDAAELAAMQALYTATAQPAPADGVTAVVAALLQAPQFLYRPEPSSGAPLGGYALATRLSYLLVSSTPDAALLDAAEAGRLDTPAGLAAEADRLLAQPRAAETFAHFVSQWWELQALPALEKDRSLYRTWTNTTAAAFAEETRQFLADAWQRGPTLDALLNAPVTFVDPGLATFYGLSAPAGANFQRVELDPARGFGLLSQGAFLATHAKADQTSPVLRGKFVRAQLFCAPPPAPPPDIVIKPPTVDPRLSTRERFAQHTADPTCAACHAYMDPVGFAFEHYDAAGRWRDVDGGKPVDAAGALTGTDVDGTLAGLADLAPRLAASKQVARCAATQWFRYAFGRSEQTPRDDCSVDTLAAALSAPGGDLRALVRATVALPVFRARPLAEEARP